MTAALSTFLATLAAAVSAFAAFGSFYYAFGNASTQALDVALDAVTNTEAAQARLLVRRAASRQRLGHSELEDFDAAQLTLLWALQRLRLQRATIKGNGWVDDHATLLYEHVADIVDSLNHARGRHSSTAHPHDVELANRSIAGLPRIDSRWVPWPFHRTKTPPPAGRIA